MTTIHVYKDRIEVQHGERVTSVHSPAREGLAEELAQDYQEVNTGEYATVIDHTWQELGHQWARELSMNWYSAMADIDQLRRECGDARARQFIDRRLAGEEISLA